MDFRFKVAIKRPFLYAGNCRVKPAEGGAYLYGYDTLIAAKGQTGKPDWPWQTVRETRRQDGSSQIMACINLPEVQISYHEAKGDRPWSELRVQASLPKVLYGTNARDLVAMNEVRAAVDQVSAALEVVTGEQADLLGWDVRRVDVTADRVLPSEAHVRAALVALARVRIRRQMPVRGQSGSISWPGRRGGFTRKAYSKYLESGVEAAQGRLRVEVGAMGQKALKRMHPGPVMDGQKVRVCDLLTEGAEKMRERTVRVMVELVDKVFEELVDVDAMKAFWAFKAGDRRSDYAGRMIGYAYLVQRFGWEFLDGVVDRVTVYRVRKEFRRVGIDPMEVDFTQGGPVDALEELVEKAHSQGAQEIDDSGIRRVAAGILDKEYPEPTNEDLERRGF